MRLLDVWKIKNQRVLCFIMALEDKALYCHIKSGAAYWKTLHPRAIPHHHHHHSSLRTISTNTWCSLHWQTIFKDTSDLLAPISAHEWCKWRRNPVWLKQRRVLLYCTDYNITCRLRFALFLLSTRVRGLFFTFPSLKFRWKARVHTHN